MNSRYWITPSWGATSSLVSQKVSSILWNLEVHYHCHKSPPFVQMQSMPSSSSVSSVHILPSYLFKIYFNSTHPAMLRSSKWFLSFRFPHQNPGHFLLSTVHATAGVIFQTIMLFSTLKFWTYNLIYLTPSTLGNEVYTNLKNILCFTGSSREDSFRLTMRLEEVTWVSTVASKNVTRFTKWYWYNLVCVIPETPGWFCEPCVVDTYWKCT
jgi:hypothetical protein